MQKRYAIPLIAICLGVLLVAGCVFGPGHAAVTLRNNSGAVVSSATIAVDDNVYTFTDIPAGETRHASFRIWADGSYNVHVKLLGGRELAHKDGYLTNGVDSTDVIDIRADSVGIVMGYK